MGSSGWKFPASKAVQAAEMKKTRMPILIRTIAVLTSALARPTGQQEGCEDHDDHGRKIEQPDLVRGPARASGSTSPQVPRVSLTLSLAPTAQVLLATQAQP